jgi:hypothetical protein
MLFISIIIIIACKALINDKLSRDFYHRISAIILLFTGILAFNSIFNLEDFTVIEIYSGLFTLTTTIFQSFLSIVTYINQTLILGSHYTTIFQSFLSIGTYINQTLILGSHYIELIIYSFIFNFILLKLINYNLFGVEIKKNVYKLLNLKLFFIYYFIFIFLLIFIIKLNIIYLDSKDVIVKANVSNVEINVSGKMLSELLSGFGDIAAFGVGARIALAAAAKHQMSVGSKIGISITSGGFTAGGLNILRKANYTSELLEKGVSAKVVLNDVTFSSQVDYNVPQHPILDLFFGTGATFNKEKIKASFKCYEIGDKKIIEVDNDLSPILKEIKKTNPNWGTTDSQDVILSPLENNNEIIDFLIDSLTDLFVMIVGTVYLLLMLTIIFICKIAINKEIEIKFLTKLKIFNIEIGSKINNFINWYINIWQKSSNFWIFLILFVLIFGNTCSLYFLYKILYLLKKII